MRGQIFKTAAGKRTALMQPPQNAIDPFIVVLRNVEFPTLTRKTRLYLCFSCLESERERAAFNLTSRLFRTEQINRLTHTHSHTVNQQQ